MRSNRLAGSVEGRLRDGVVAGHELELDCFAGLGGDLVGGVDESAVVANGDDVGFLGGDGCREGGEPGEEEVGEMHFCCVECVF